ncbi:MAG: porin [Methylophilaceae bacterium]
MNNTIKLAVASALLAAASSANAGIMIPAGDWTLDIGGIVNAYYTSTSFSGTAGTAPLGLGNGAGNTSSNITTGLLPNYLSVSGKTRQNDLDVGFTISLNPGSSTTQGGGQSATQENRQAFLTVGDASWGSVKFGKDLGIFASDAILNDMTLLGVGSGAGSLAGNTTTLGRIGTGYVYADWKSQIAYTSPNWNGFAFTAGVTQSWDAVSSLGGVNSTGTTNRGGAQPAFEGKASYTFADVNGSGVGGKVWVSGITQKVAGLNDRAEAIDVGANVNMAGFGLTGYYYTGSGIGQTFQLFDGFDASGKSRDSDGYYVQGTYTIPTVGTKIGVSWGESNLDANGAADLLGDVTDQMWTVGAYHPLTKHLNLVAEYSESKHETTTTDGKAKTIALGAILFF